MGGVWVHGPLTAGALEPATLELLSAARAIDPDTAAVVLGAGAAMPAVAKALAARGARRIFHADDPVYDDHLAEPAVHALATLAREHRPDLILFCQTFDGRDIAGRLSALLGTALVSNADEILAVDRMRIRVPLSVWPGRPGNLKGGVGGTKVVDVTLRGPRPYIAIPRARAFEVSEAPVDAEVVAVEVEIPERLRRTRRVARHVDLASGPNLDRAKVVVSGGRGLREAENFALLAALAETIPGAAVGASRPTVDAGWAPYRIMVGQTGTTVTPEVYLAVGISGATQHVVAIKNAKWIVAINTDRGAPIFQIADLGVVADALEILPELTALLRARHLTTG